MNDTVQFNLPEDIVVPEGRKKITDENARWLIRNLGIKNSDHPKCNKIIEQLKKTIRRQNND